MSISLSLSTSEELSEPLDVLSITLIDYSYCIGCTKAGKQCRKRPIKNSYYCKCHKSMFKFAKPDECSICFESMHDVQQPLSCGHWVHRSCILKWKDECPICRTKIKVTTKEYRKLNRHYIEEVFISDFYAYILLLLNSVPD